MHVGSARIGAILLPAEWGDFWNDSLQKALASLAVLAATTVGSFVLGRWWGKRRARRQWERKSFLDRLNVSLNQFNDGKLQIRTLMERSLEQVFQNATTVND